MDIKEKLLTELEIKMDQVVFKYENLFKTSDLNPEDFLKKKYKNMRSELARLATDILHQSILNGVSSDETFILSVQKLNIQSADKLMLILKKSE